MDVGALAASAWNPGQQPTDDGSILERCGRYGPWRNYDIEKDIRLAEFANHYTFERVYSHKKDKVFGTGDMIVTEKVPVFDKTKTVSWYEDIQETWKDRFGDQAYRILLSRGVLHYFYVPDKRFGVRPVYIHPKVPMQYRENMLSQILWRVHPAAIRNKQFKMLMEQPLMITDGRSGSRVTEVNSLHGEVPKGFCYVPPKKFLTTIWSRPENGAATTPLAKLLPYYELYLEVCDYWRTAMQQSFNAPTIISTSKKPESKEASILSASDAFDSLLAPCPDAADDGGPDSKGRDASESDTTVDARRRATIYAMAMTHAINNNLDIDAVRNRFKAESNSSKRFKYLKPEQKVERRDAPPLPPEILEFESALTKAICAAYRVPDDLQMPGSTGGKKAPLIENNGATKTSMKVADESSAHEAMKFAKVFKRFYRFAYGPHLRAKIAKMEYSDDLNRTEDAIKAYVARPKTSGGSSSSSSSSSSSNDIDSKKRKREEGEADDEDDENEPEPGAEADGESDANEKDECDVDDKFGADFVLPGSIKMDKVHELAASGWFDPETYRPLAAMEAGIPVSFLRKEPGPPIGAEEKAKAESKTALNTSQNKKEGEIRALEKHDLPLPGEEKRPAKKRKTK